MNDTEVSNNISIVGKRLAQAKDQYKQLCDAERVIVDKRQKLLSSMPTIFSPVLAKMNDLGRRNIDGEESIRFVNFCYDRFRARNGGKGMLPKIAKERKRLYGKEEICCKIIEGETFVQVGTYTGTYSDGERYEADIMLPEVWFYEPENWETRYTELFNELMIPVLKQEQLDAQESEQTERENFMKLKAKFEPAE